MYPETIVFYSWQSDLPLDINQRAIAISLKSAFIDIEEKLTQIKLKFDEATRDEPGSPEIPKTIFNKISIADIFVCDVTTINKSDAINRKMPNPNVLIELGYAIALLGWERIVMLFNKNYGTFPTDLPFDLDKRRVIQFNIKDKSDKSGKSDLKQKLGTALETIIKKNPSKPFDQKAKTEEEITRDKDIANLKRLFGTIHIETFDNFINQLPNKIIGKIFAFWYAFLAIHESNTFYLYNERTSKVIVKFKKCWAKTLSFEEHFSSSHNRKDYHYHLPSDMFPSKKSEEDFQVLCKETLKLKKEFKGLLSYIRLNYIELNLDELSRSAIKRNNTEEKKISKSFNSR
jgi:hypothetical protein